MRSTIWPVLALLVLGLGEGWATAGEPVPLAKGVRGLVTKASGKIVIDGKLNEWTEAFCTPVNYGQKNLENRAAQFFYLWDDEALYIGLRCLDRKQANAASQGAIYDGDAVEFYLDTRPGETLRGKDWTAGAIHFYFTAFEGKDVKPRWAIRQGIATSGTVLKGAQIAATSTPESVVVEFRLPWSNFPEFSPKPGAVLAMDAELCSGDGGKRTDRTFAYGSPLSVQQPASQAKVELVRSFDPEYFEAVGPSAFPFRVETPWVQPARANVQGVVAVPPAFAEIVGEVQVRIHDTDGKIVRTIPARLESFGPKALNFVRAVASWSIDDFAPGTYFATARVIARTEKTMTTVAPRMVDEAIISGR